MTRGRHDPRPPGDGIPPAPGPSGSGRRRPATEHPFCFADDWGRYASAFARHNPPASVNHIIRTPNIDRVAARGALFRNALAPAPSCTPCCSSLLSGRYFWNTGRGAILQGAAWGAAIPSFPLPLRDAG